MLTKTHNRQHKLTRLFILAAALLLLWITATTTTVGAQTPDNDRHGEGVRIETGRDDLQIHFDTLDTNAQIKVIFEKGGEVVGSEMRRAGNPIPARGPIGEWPPEGWVCPPELTVCIPNIIVPVPDPQGNLPDPFPPEGWTCPPELTVCIPDVLIPPTQGQQAPPNPFPFPKDGWECPPELNVCIPTIITIDNGSSEGPVDPNPFPPEGWVCPDNINFCVPGSITTPTCDPNLQGCPVSWSVVFDRELVLEMADGNRIEADTVRMHRIETERNSGNTMEVIQFGTSFTCESFADQVDICRANISIQDSCTDADNCDLGQLSTPTSVKTRNMGADDKPASMTLFTTLFMTLATMTLPIIKRVK